MKLDELAQSLRDFEGVTRKRAIGPLVKWFDEDRRSGNFGEDAAVVERGEESLLLAADGIWSKLMDSDPEWAGYCAVLVNIHDILAMGGTPVAMVDVFSANSPSVCNRVLAGMSEAIQKFGVPVVGGHVHPDTSYNALDVAIIGTAKTDSIIYSCNAREGHDVIAAIDLDGRVHPSCSLCWDTTTMKRPEMLRKQLQAMPHLARQHLATAGKDISNPGLIGTLGMLLEVSEAGARVELDSIPIPDGMDMSEWLTMYPGMGFVLTARPKNTPTITRIFEEAGMDAAKIGEVTDTRKLELTENTEKVVVWDFAYDTIMGIGAVLCK
ncbi:MAG TPA: methanogenesis marker 2 protein [Candidatus Bathyarchaeia archaeon]|nr:methanogenesis marker 2 protein [Candidatus Bathyarchaeia archaeon]